MRRQRARPARCQIERPPRSVLSGAPARHDTTSCIGTEPAAGTRRAVSTCARGGTNDCAASRVCGAGPPTTRGSSAEPSNEISFAPARVLLQDFTGVPAVVDLAAMREAMSALGGDPKRINPLIPAELVIDHSVQVDAFASRMAMATNTELEFERNF